MREGQRERFVTAGVPPGARIDGARALIQTIHQRAG